ncbi:MAG TPA: CDP-diacylglycerol--serine O-phosphatidyltransferase [Gammaproteobacteria bacterium]|nr:CDP-diacylglycerol--serine O-phosphatidyltransferase [Gammaproteobacteria bacterium]MCH77975.1 CDP-diacylglycerol--serine O-phosphatidyltransferase [Gammaproteobacteria bacterium]
MTATNGRPTSRGAAVYILPNLFTTIGLFAGFYAIVAGVNGQFEIASIAILVAGVLDGLDGRVARMTNTESAFGAQYDSMTDMVAFGVAPALLVYKWTLFQFGKMGWMLAFLYAAAVAIRLARFNVESGKVSKRYFRGLSSPPSAGLLIAMVWVGEVYELQSVGAGVFAALVTFVAAGLMVSNVPYFSFKDVDLRSRVSIFYVVLFAFCLALFFTNPPLVLFLISFTYALVGALVMPLVRLRRRRRAATLTGGTEASTSETAASD